MTDDWWLFLLLGLLFGFMLGTCWGQYLEAGTW